MPHADDIRWHELKTWPDPFRAVVRGEKSYEIRRNDRDFRVGDYLLLREYDGETGRYGDESFEVQVTYMTPGGAFGLPDDLCVMGLRRIWHNVTAEQTSKSLARMEAHRVDPR